MEGQQFPADFQKVLSEGLYTLTEFLGVVRSHKVRITCQ